MRRLTAVLGILALAVTMVPSELPTNPLDCCTGTMCPMHAAQGHALNCDMERNRSTAALKPCPVQSTTYYTGAVLFVLLAPTILHRDLRSEPAIAFFSDFSPNAERRVESPPPRLLQTP